MVNNLSQMFDEQELIKAEEDSSQKPNPPSSAWPKKIKTTFGNGSTFLGDESRTASICKHIGADLGGVVSQEVISSNQDVETKSWNLSPEPWNDCSCYR